MSVIVDGSNGLIFNDASTQTTAATGFGFKNRIINGDMRIDQRTSGTYSAYASGTYVVDRWQYQASQASKFIIGQNLATAPVTPPAGYNHYLGVQVNSAVTVGSTDYFQILQPIEGFNTSDLDFGKATAKTVTLSFWVRCSLTGTFGGALRNSAGNYCYPFSYTISSANTWTQISITIAGPTSGTWVGATNGAGLIVNFSLGMGSTYSGTAGAWAASDYSSATSAVSVVGTSSATFYITGVQLEKGSTATAFDYRAYGHELALCQRYCYALRASETPSGGNYLTYGLAQAISGTYACSSVIPKVTMRTTPTLTTTGTASDYALYAGSFYTFGTVPIITGDSNPSSFNIDATSVSGVTLGFCYRFLSNNNRTSYLIFSAEL